ncbi:polysaccharide export outer membrane protein [Sphingomonas sp. UYAg733]
MSRVSLTVKKAIWQVVLPIAAMPGIALAQASGPVAPTVPASQVNGGYLLGPDDEIKISVYNQADLSVTTRVKTDGTVILAFLGAVPARGKTTAQLAADLSAAYAKGGYLINPSINVEVSQFVSRFVTVLGNVPQAGNYPLDRPYSLASMLAKAGGATANGANAVILTPADGSGAVRISLVEMGPGANRQLMPGDILFVPPAEKVYVYGQVQQAGAFTYVPGQTFRQVLALAGGPTLAGSTRRIKVRRGGKELADVMLDDPIQPEDVLIIREKLF